MMFLEMDFCLSNYAKLEIARVFPVTVPQSYIEHIKV